MLGYFDTFEFFSFKIYIFSISHQNLWFFLKMYSKKRGSTTTVERNKKKKNSEDSAEDWDITTTEGNYILY
jgi:hypothetical protein